MAVQHADAPGREFYHAVVYQAVEDAVYAVARGYAAKARDVLVADGKVYQHAVPVPAPELAHQHVQQGAYGPGLAVHYHHLLTVYGLHQIGAVVVLDIGLQASVGVDVVPELHARDAVKAHLRALDADIEGRARIAADLVAQQRDDVRALEIGYIELAPVLHNDAGLYHAVTQDVGVLLLIAEILEVGVVPLCDERYAALVQIC